MIRITIFNEFYHEREHEEAKKIYPNGIHTCIGEFLKEDDISITYATLDMPENGLPQEVIDNTDVLIWWGHMKHELVTDEVTARVKEAVNKGMGAIFLHSAHFSKPFKALMGTSCDLKWREDEGHTRLWVVDPSNPIVKGLNADYFELEHEETYGEFFDIPQPDRLVFISWHKGGEVFRSGCCYRRGLGRIFYFQPGHETYPTYYNENVQLVIKNAVRWVNMDKDTYKPVFGQYEAVEKF